MNTKAGDVKAVESLFGSGRFREAEQAARKSIATWGETIPLLNFLGSSLFNQGKHAESEPILDRSLKLSPRQFNTLVTQGQNKELLGKIRQALDLYLNAGLLTRGDSFVSFKIGAMYNRLDRDAEAVRYLEESVRLAPDFAEAHAELGRVFMTVNERSRAASSLRRALELKPSLLDARSRLGWLLIRMEQVPAAIEHFEAVLRADPSYIPAHLGLGRAYRDLHQTDKAVASYREALRLDPNSASALHDLSTLKRFEPGDPDIARMRDILGRDDRRLSPALRVRLSCALAKALEDTGEYDESTSLYLEAKRQARAATPYSNEAPARFFSRIKAVFDAPTIAKGRARGLRGTAPVFVVGLPRSGKTSVAELLGRHPRAVPEPEMVGVSWIARRLVPDTAGPFDPEAVRQALFQPRPEETASVGPGSAANMVKISSNPGNFWALGVIEMMFPDARIIHCRRDPLSACLSIFRSTFNDSRLLYCDSIEDTIEYIRLYDDLMNHWRSVLGIEIHEVRYDELAAGGEAAQAALFAAAGLDMSEVPGPAPELSLGSYLDNGLESYQQGADGGAARQSAEMAEAFARKVPALRQFMQS